VAAASLPAAVGAAVPSIDWTQLLPALPSPNEPQPGPVPNCRRPTIACVQTEIDRMTALRDRLGCDHRAVFATTYLTLTQVFKGMLKADPSFVRFRRYLYTEDAVFANVYFNTLRAWNRSEPVPAAWRIALETAQTGQVNAAQDMLLGINAHVQNDMPFVIASLGVRTRNGQTRKPDHDVINHVLDRAYEPVVNAIRERFDPLVGITNSPLTPLDDFAGLQLVRLWREQVWRNAERLLNAKTDAERARITGDIQAYAADWAKGIAAFPQPGYRASRDAYCEQQLAAQSPPTG
jgi:Family of unknown function (DUF5995)